MPPVSHGMKLQLKAEPEFEHSAIICNLGFPTPSLKKKRKDFKLRNRLTEKEAEIEKRSCMFITQMAATTRAKLIRSQGPEASSASPRQV